MFFHSIHKTFISVIIIHFFFNCGLLQAKNISEISRKEENTIKKMLISDVPDQLDSFLRESNLTGNDVDKFILDKASYYGSIKVIKQLAINIVDINETNALINACKKGHFEIVKYLIESCHADMNKVENTYNMSPLEAALTRSGKENYQIVEYLINAGVNLNRNIPPYGGIILTKLCNMKDDKLALLAIKKGCKILPYTNTHKVDTPLIVAIRKNHKILINTLIKEKAYDLKKIPSMNTAISIAASSCDKSIIAMLIEQGFPIDTSYIDNRNRKQTTTAIINAAQDNTVSVVKYLTNSGANINGKNKYGWSALHASAINTKNIDIANFLLEKGLSPNHLDKKGQTALHVACSRDNIEVAKSLVENGASLDIVDHKGKTPIVIASRNHLNENLTLFLLKAGADYNNKNVIINICNNGFAKSLIYTLEHGVNVDIIGGYRKQTPIFLTIKDFHSPNSRSMHRNLISRLAQQSSLATLSVNEYEAVFLAAEKGLAGVVETAIKKGFDYSTELKGKNIFQFFLSGDGINGMSFNRSEPYKADELLSLMIANEQIPITGQYKDKTIKNLLKANMVDSIIQLDTERTFANQYNQIRKRKLLDQLRFYITNNDIEKFKKEIISTIDIDDEMPGLLNYAAKSNKPIFFELLLSRGVTPDDQSFLKMSIRSFNNPKLLSELLSNPSVSVDAKNILLCEATRNNKIKVVKTILESGANINTTFTPLKDHNDNRYIGLSPLMIAATNGNLELLEYIIDLPETEINFAVDGVDLRKKGNSTFKTLVQTSKRNHYKYAESNEEIKGNYQAIYFACFLSSKKHNEATRNKILNTLLNAGASINPKQPNVPPLLAAIRSRNIDTVQYLLKNGAHVNSLFPQTPLLIALKNKNREISSLLIEHNANIHIKDSLSGKSYADLAAELMLISLLGKLDTDDKYLEIRNKYSPMPKSTLVGTWYNGQNEFKEFGVILKPNGTGIFYISIGAGFGFYWGEYNNEVHTKLMPIDPRVIKGIDENNFFKIINFSQGSLNILFNGEVQSLIVKKE